MLGIKSNLTILTKKISSQLGGYEKGQITQLSELTLKIWETLL